MTAKKISVKHIANSVLFVVGAAALWFCWPFWDDNFGGQLFVLFDRSPSAAMFLTISSVVALIFIVTLASVVWNNGESIRVRAMSVYSRIKRYVIDPVAAVPVDVVVGKPVIAEKSIDVS